MLGRVFVVPAANVNRHLSVAGRTEPPMQVESYLLASGEIVVEEVRDRQGVGVSLTPSVDGCNFGFEVDVPLAAGVSMLVPDILSSGGTS